MSTVGYIRTENVQGNAQSFETQKNSIEKYAMFNDLTIKKIYYDDKLYGENFEKMLSELEPSTIVICDKLSTLCDSVLQLCSVYETIKNKNCYIVLPINQIDTRNNNSKLMLGLLYEFSEMDRAYVNKQLREQKNELFFRGSLKKKPPFGFTHDKATGGLQEDEDEMKIVNKIRSLIKSDNKIPVSEIIRILKADGVKIRKSKDIYHTSIQNIIHQYKMR